MSRSIAHRVLYRGTIALVVALLASLTGLTLSASATPVWRVDGIADSTVAPGSQLQYLVQTTNVGDEPMNGSEFTLTVTLPTHVTGVSVELNEFSFFIGWTCTAGDGVSPVAGASTIKCVSTLPLPPYTVFALVLPVINAAVDPEASGTLTAHLSLEGGGAPNIATTVVPVRVSADPPRFGVTAFDGQDNADAAGDPLTQAGGHPYDASASIDVATATSAVRGPVWPVEAVKDTLTDLPPGFAGSPLSAARCSLADLAISIGPNPEPACAPTSQVGTVLVRGNGFGGMGNVQGPIPLFNLTTPPDVPARFGFNLDGVVVPLDARVRSDGDYGLSIDSHDISEAIGVAGVTVTFWGVPADASHDSERACPGQLAPWQSGPSCQSGGVRSALLRNPTSCTAPGEGLSYAVHADSWVNPGQFAPDGGPAAGDARWRSAGYVSHGPPGYPFPPGEQGATVGIDGCEKVPFTPSMQMQPTSNAPDSPTGLAVTVTVPQEALEDPNAISQADLRRTVVTLPEGMTINPSQADGLQACTQAQIGLHSTADPTCPEASKIGSVELETPLLEKPLEGSIYLATQGDNPFGTLTAIYVVVKGGGTIVKLPGRIDLDPSTGRLRTTFDNTPQLPFSKFTLTFDSGPRAPLVNPATCGTKTFEAMLEGWNGKTVTRSSSYEVECTPGLGGFAPSFTGGTVNPLAGAFSPLVLSLSRHDGEQRVAGLTDTLPPGASAILAGVPLCSAGDAAAGTCSAASQIGTVTVGSGAGSNPVFLGGKVYLTGPYNGGAYGEVVVIHAAAGPFDLGTVVVRGSIRIDPHTAQATVVSDPFPTFVNQTGIPADVRRVDVTLDRPGFIFNPTDCEPLSMNGTLTSAQGASVAVSSRFQAAECSGLPFHPKFTASTQGNATFSGHGASLNVKASTKGGPGVKAGEEEANLRRVEVQLPLALPARLTTLQKACTEGQFAANPAGCPAASNVGLATVNSPVLPDPLRGPAYLVSHGGAGFPDLVLVLQADGVTVDVVSATVIKRGITYSKFEAVPDAPFSSFEVNLPEGRYSALAGNKNLCAPTKTVTVRRRVTRKVHGRTVHTFKQVKQTVAEPLAMPMTLTGQNGAVVRQTLKIAVTGCAGHGAAPVKGRKK